MWSRSGDNNFNSNAIFAPSSARLGATSSTTVPGTVVRKATGDLREVAVLGEKKTGLHGQHQSVQGVDLATSRNEIRTSHVCGKTRLHCSPSFRLIQSPHNAAYVRGETRDTIKFCPCNGKQHITRLATLGCRDLRC
jgi:hypothetical protein